MKHKPDGRNWSIAGHYVVDWGNDDRAVEMLKEPCKHPGYANRITHPCESWGRTGGRK